MKTSHLLAASVLAMAAASPASGQTVESAEAVGQATTADETTQLPTGPSAGAAGDVIVTAQRQSQRLQDVPIAVSAFSGAALAAQQINNANDLQLTLPNVQFTKTNFTSSSFTIRGIGDLCTGFACDQATAIHLNDEPLFNTRIFETEYFDIERIEVLRGPQGTLFGRNATAGVVNLVTAKPDLTRFAASGEAEYGNFDSYKLRGMINVPIGDTIGVRLAGYYLNRDGYTFNQFNDSRIDGRKLYNLRGTLRFEPSADTTIDLIGSYFREKDDRTRIQKHLCQSDPTGVMACLSGRLDFGVTNGNGNFTGGLNSREFFRIQGIPEAFALTSLYGPNLLSGYVNPADVRVVNTDFDPTYFAEEYQAQVKLRQRIGKFDLSLSGTYQNVTVDARQNYFGAIQNRALIQPALDTLAAAAAGLIPGLPAAYFRPVANALIPNGPAGVLCTSEPERTNTGVYGGHSVCADTPLQFDRSSQKNEAFSVEGIVTSDFDGSFDFLLGGIYAQNTVRDGDYYVNTFGIDYLSGILGAFTALGAGLPPAYLGSPFSHSNNDLFRLSSYGIFGEGYLRFNDELKVTLGLRYNHDQKTVRARNTIASFLVPHGAADAFDSPYVATGFDADPGTLGNQIFQDRRTTFSEFTGRAVIDYQVTPDNLLYASYSRGYKSGGINPPLSPVFEVAENFEPEFINAFEIGSKNTFGALTLNLTAFYYQYKALQLSRLVARTSVNDNIDADIYGVEAEAVIRPARNFQVNLGASYLHTKVTSNKLLANPRDPSGGRADAVIIKDITNGANCAVRSNTGSAAAANGFVGAVNAALGLRPPTAFPADSGLTANGAFSLCSVLTAQSATPAAAALGGITVDSGGVLVNIRGNEIPQAPVYKFSAGAQYTADLSGGYRLVPRVDLAYTAEFTSNIFNLPIDRVEGYVQVNAQIQLTAPEDRFFLRGFVQNVTNDSSITGQQVTDAASGLFTNIFTLEPRRYGVAAGFKF
ncbi:TonB-dependent receptor [uncultured Sphingomonas sp.]|uniref:TonB-dependent receptor n=1 Tax=uncultured Sphingomonas sp. TaxID=158754 RepID=UPI0035CC7008